MKNQVNQNMDILRTFSTQKNGDKSCLIRSFRYGALVATSLDYIYKLNYESDFNLRAEFSKVCPNDKDNRGESETDDEVSDDFCGSCPYICFDPPVIREGFGGRLALGRSAELPKLRKIVDMLGRNHLPDLSRRFTDKSMTVGIMLEKILDGLKQEVFSPKTQRINGYVVFVRLLYFYLTYQWHA